MSEQNDVSTDSDGDYPPTPGDTLIFENDRVRVWSMTLPPHGMFDWHQHWHDHLIIWPDAGRAQAQRLDDEDWTISQTAEAGFVLFKTVGRSGPQMPHRIRNLTDRENTHYIIELIGEPSPSEVELPNVPNERGSAVFTATGEPV